MTTPVTSELARKQPAQIVHTGQPKRRPRSVFDKDSGGSGPAVLYLLLGMVAVGFAILLLTLTF